MNEEELDMLKLAQIREDPHEFLETHFFWIDRMGKVIKDSYDKKRYTRAALDAFILHRASGYVEKALTKIATEEEK